MKFNLIGTKEDLLSEILKKEEISPSDFLLRTKAKAVPIPISLRRIQQYIDEGIIPRGRLENGTDAPRGRYFFEDHLIHYLAAIRLKKAGEATENLAPILQSLSHSELIKIASDTSSFQKTKGNRYGTKELSLRSELRRLGRKEGRALKSTHLRLAITPWCHVTLNTNNISTLSDHDVDVLSRAFQQALKNELPVANSKKTLNRP